MVNFAALLLDQKLGKFLRPAVACRRNTRNIRVHCNLGVECTVGPMSITFLSGIAVESREKNVCDMPWELVFTCGSRAIGCVFFGNTRLGKTKCWTVSVLVHMIRSALIPSGTGRLTITIFL